jgi:hypothetical protein
MNFEAMTEEAIRHKAYGIWERQGCEGDPIKHWFQAKHELEAMGDQQTG